MNIEGDTARLIHQQTDTFRYNFFAVRKFDYHYFVCGQVNEAGKFFIEDPDGAHGFLMKMDTMGNQVWVQHYDNSWKIDFMDISPEGEFVLGSSDFDIGGPFSIQNMLIKTDAEGNEKWRFIFGGDFWQDQTPVEFSNDGHVIAAGSNGNEIELTTPIRMLKFQDMGSYGEIIEDHEYYFESQRPAIAYSLIEDEEGNIFAGGLLVGETDQGIQHRYGAIMKFNSELDSLWFRTYTFYAESEHWHIIRDIAFAEDGGFVMTGFAEEGSDAPIPLLDHIWTLKVDEFGCLEPGCEIVGTQEIIIGLQDAMKVYPNPVQDVLNLQWNLPPNFNSNDFQNQKLHIINSLGQIVHTAQPERSRGLSDLQIGVSTLPIGHYTLHWMSDNTWLDSVKFIKE